MSYDTVENALERELANERSQHIDTMAKLDSAYEIIDRMSACGIMAARILGDISAWPSSSCRCPLPASEPGGYGDGFEAARARWQAFVLTRVDPDTLGVPKVFIFQSAADYVFRRVMEDNISEGNCRLHGLYAAEQSWRKFKTHNPGAELEGMMASWLTECGLRDYNLKDQVYALLFGPDHKWVKIQPTDPTGE